MYFLSTGTQLKFMKCQRTILNLILEGHGCACWRNYLKSFIFFLLAADTYEEENPSLKASKFLAFWLFSICLDLASCQECRLQEILHFIVILSLSFLYCGSWTHMGHLTWWGAHKKLTALKCFWVQDAQKLIQNQLCNESEVFLAVLICAAFLRRKGVDSEKRLESPVLLHIVNWLMYL